MTNLTEDTRSDSKSASISSTEGGESSKVASTIKLTTFALYSARGTRTDRDVKVVVGATNPRVGDDHVIELDAANVPFSSRKFKDREPKEGHGLLMLYGIRDALEEVMKWRKVAREKPNTFFASAEIEIEVGHLEAGLVDRAMLQARGADMAFANLRRMTADAQSFILEKFAEYAAQDNLKPEAEMSRISQIAMHPEYLDRLFRDDKALKHLSIFVTQVADDPAVKGRMRAMAYVRPGAKIVGIKQASTEARIVLPKWMESEAAAARHRKRLESA